MINNLQDEVNEGVRYNQEDRTVHLKADLLFLIEPDTETLLVVGLLEWFLRSQTLFRTFQQHNEEQNSS